MLIPGIARHGGEREAGRYDAWEAALTRFREDWKRGLRPEAGNLAGYAESVPDGQRLETLADLVFEHMRLSWTDGRRTFVETYAPTLGEGEGALPASGVTADLVEGEFLARNIPPHGDRPGLDEYRQRFPGHGEALRRLEVRFIGGGRHVLLRRLGPGGMAQVWEGFDHHLKRRVAIKVPLPGADEAALRSLAREALVLARLDHPGVSLVHEYREGPEGRAFLVLSFAAGRTLGERARELHRTAAARSAGETRRLWDRLLSSYLSVCETVAYAHSQGVIHGDLKPGNVLAGDTGETAILDWGLARFAGEAPPAGVLSGTPEYMAPEQAQGIVDERTDVFGLGAILHELLTGRPPHAWQDGVRPLDWRRVVGEAWVRRLGRLAPGAPRESAAICLAALARHPDERPASAAALAEAVRNLLARRAARGPWRRLREFFRRTYA